MNRVVALVAVGLLIGCSRSPAPPGTRPGSGLTHGAVESSFKCTAKVTFHAATNTTYVSVTELQGTVDGAEVVVPGMFVVAGRPAVKSYSMTDPFVRGSLVGIRGKNGVTLVAGKNLTTGEVHGRVTLKLVELAEVPGAELQEDQMFLARGEIEADLSTPLSSPAGGAVHMTVSF